MKRIILLIIILISVEIFADLNFGKDLFEDQLYDEAIQELEQIITSNPTSEDAQEAMFLIGESYREQAKYSLAEASYKRLLDGYPSLLFREQVIHRLASVQMQQERYDKAIINFNTLLEKYPLTEYTKKSLEKYLNCLYQIGKYDQVISEGNKLVKSYNMYPNIPRSLLWIAKAYNAKNMVTKSQNILSKITNDFPDHVVRWNAIKMKITLTEANQGTMEAAQRLNEHLQNDIPRIYEKDLRYKLVGYYLELNEYLEAYKQLKYLSTKFSNAEDLDIYLLKLSDTQLELKKYNEILTEYPQNKKVFKKSLLSDKYDLNLSRAEFHTKNYKDADEKVQKILKNSKDEETNFKARVLKSKILQAEGNFNATIDLLQQLLDSSYAQKDDILLQLGIIYQEEFKNFNTAIQYYQQVLTYFSTRHIRQKAIYKIALCYENLGEYDKALTRLSQINYDNVKDLTLKNKIIQKKDYIKKFKIRNYEDAFDDLLQSLYKYQKDSENKQLQIDILDIYTHKLKEYENSLDMIGSTNDPILNYRKALIYLKLAEKASTEAKKQEADKYVGFAEDVMDKLSEEQHKHWLNEINIRKQIVQKESYDNDLIKKLEKFVLTYPQVNAANQFLLIVSNYYLDKGVPEKAYLFINKLRNDGSINEFDFYEAKIHLAEYFYRNNDDEKAKENYNIAESFINLNRPEIYFHYAVVLYETGYEKRAHDMLAFLLQNAEKFEDYDAVISYFTKKLIKENKLGKAIKFMLYKSEENRGDEFYRTLSDNYLKINDKEKAKEALMHIVDKKDELLRKLADLQFETGEYEMAKYSFSKLLSRNNSDLESVKMLGRIAFKQKKYLEAAKKYKKIVETLGDDFNNFEDISQIAKENIISLYRIENRPKAEKLQKRFKKILSDEIINEITLNKGIYYTEIDKEKAESIFTKLLKDENLSTALIIRSYFWRGVVRMKMKDIEKAEGDFLVVSKSVDKELSNQANLKLGTINFSNENYQKALAHYSKVIENDVKGELALDAARNFAFVCKTMKEWGKAITAYQLILERWGDERLEAETLFDIAFCYFRDKDYYKSIEMFNQTLQLLSKDELKAEAQYWIGESFYNLENYEKAASELLKVRYNYSEITQWAASAELRVGEAYMNLERKKRAVRIYERIIERYGKYSQWGKEAENRLKSL